MYLTYAYPVLTCAARSVQVCAGAGLGDESLRFITIKSAFPSEFPLP